MADSATTGAAASRFEALRTAREPFDRRARDAATLTIPYLIPPLGFNSAMQLPTPYQSLGARGVRNLASKLLMALFPTNTTFFKYEIDDFVLDDLNKEGPVTRGAFELAMNRRERAIMTEINKALLRVTAATALTHLIVAGNFLLHAPPKGRTQGFRLDQYVVRRDPLGNILEIVVEEALNIHTLPAAARAAIGEERMDKAEGEDEKGQKGTGDKTSKLYTHIYLDEDEGLYKVYQEAEGVLIPGSEGSYPRDELPWFPLRWSAQPGEDYGRGYVEELLGDLDSLEGLSQTLVEGIAAAARVVFLVNPSGVTRIQVVAKARNGDVRAGRAEDVTVVETAHKSADFQTAQRQAEAIATRLSYAFMLNSTVQRNADRVTAEEIRYVAGELDDALGGLYTLLAAEFQLPVVQAFERRMRKAKGVPPIPKNIAEPTITTGLEAIGRGNDLQAMKAWVADVLQIVGPEEAFKRIDAGEFLKRSAAAYGIDTANLMLSDEVLAQINQQQQLQALVEKLGPNAVNQLGGMAQTAMQGQQDAALQQQTQEG